MLGALGTILGSPKAFGKVFDAARSAGDALIYTDEEKAEDAAKEAAARREFQLKMLGHISDFMKSTQGQNLTRRLIALSVTGMFVVGTSAVIGLAVSSVWVDADDMRGRLTDSAGLIAEHLQETNNAFWLVLLFYFGSPHVTAAIEAAKQIPALRAAVGSKKTEAK